MLLANPSTPSPPPRPPPAPIPLFHHCFVCVTVCVWVVWHVSVSCGSGTLSLVKVYTTNSEHLPPHRNNMTPCSKVLGAKAELILFFPLLLSFSLFLLPFWNQRPYPKGTRVVQSRQATICHWLFSSYPYSQSHNKRLTFNDWLIRNDWNKLEIDYESKDLLDNCSWHLFTVE